MKCSIKGCPGDYEAREIVHTIQRKDKVNVFGHVPAEVCSMCGDVLLKPETIRHIEDLMKTKKAPSEMVPLFEYA